MISEPRQRISSCKRPTALCSLSSERKEFEQTSSASAAVLWAAVVRSGRISCSTTGTPRAAICQAASDPASPPPMTCTARRRSSVMGRDYLVPFSVLQIAGGRNGEPVAVETRARLLRLKAKARRVRAPLELEIFALGAIPRDPRDVRPGDTDVGQFAVAELIELSQAPSKRGGSSRLRPTWLVTFYLSARPGAGQSLPVKIRFHGALQQAPCCAADMQKMHILSHWFFTKIKRFAAPNGRRKTARIWAEMRRSRPTYAPAALAPPKRFFQRGMTSRL